MGKKHVIIYKYVIYKCVMSIYNERNKKALKELEEDIIKCRELREIMPVELLSFKMGSHDSGYSCRCCRCGEKLKVKFGDYSKALDQRYVSCPKGSVDDGHGYWASVININLN